MNARYSRRRARRPPPSSIFGESAGIDEYGRFGMAADSGAAVNPGTAADSGMAVNLGIDADTGTVTAEFATVLPAVVALALLLLALTRTVMVSIGCQDAASAAARTAVTAGGSSGSSDSSGSDVGFADPSSAARAVVGDGITVHVSRSGDRVTVTTLCPVIPDSMGVLPTRVEGRAVGVIS